LAPLHRSEGRGGGAPGWLFDLWVLSVVARILGAMGGWVPVEPGWAVPASTEVADLMWLSYGSWAESRSPWAAGVMSAAVWVRGGRPAPVTGRTDAPVTGVLAEAEYWASLVVDTDPGCRRSRLRLSAWGWA
jgi:hypothetical protein